MRKYIRNRILAALIVMLGVSILSFLLLSLSGKDAAEIMARRNNINASSETVETLRNEMGLDAPLPLQYLRWLKGLFTGNMGTSLYSSKAITADLATYIPVTCTMVGLSLVWIVLLCVPISLLCVRFRDRAPDHIARAVTMVGICMPAFWLGFLLLLAFAVKIPIFKVTPEPGLKGYILPSLTLAFPVACSTIRLLRSTLLAELSSDYVRYARARGLSPSRILVSHVLRNASPPIITMFCQYLGSLVAGSAVVESVFSIKGLGSYLIACVLASDSASVASCIVLIALVFVLANLLGDIVNRLLCPWMIKESHA